MHWFKCAACGETFENDDYDEQAELGEMRRHFGDVPSDEIVSVCEECYKLIDPANPHDAEQASAENSRGPDNIKLPWDEIKLDRT